MGSYRQRYASLLKRDNYESARRAVTGDILETRGTSKSWSDDEQRSIERYLIDKRKIRPRITRQC